MKVVAINTNDYGSTGTIMLQVATLAREAGHTVQTYSKAWRYKGAGGENHSYIGSTLGNTFHRMMGPIMGKNERFSKGGTKKLIRKLQEIKPDVIHLHNLHGWYLHLETLFSYIKANNIRVIWTLHDCWALTGHCPHFEVVGCDKWKSGCYDCPQHKAYPESYVDRSKFMYALKKRCFTGIENMTVVTPSEWLAGLVKQSFLKEYPVKVIHNGIDLEIFQPTESDFRKKYHCEDKKILLGVAFGWGERKGLDVFIELSKCLPSDYQIILVGTDENVDKQLPENIISIHRTQNQKELAEIYTAADVFVNPTREEVLGLVNLEALACGVPVVTFKTGGSPECIDESCGVVVEKDDIDGLKEEIIRICKDKIFSQEACIKRARGFDKKEKFAEYLRLYEQHK